MKQTIPEFYAGQKILVTGGIGFLGKVLVEKILRCCPDVGRIYLIIRSKKGKSIEERWKEATDKPLFNKLKSLRPDALKKVSLISGDMSKEELGLTFNDKKELQEKVTIIFHAAADIQFSENIKQALVANVKATKCILDLAVTIKNLKVFTYISTAFSNYNLPPSETVEQIIPSFFDWRTLLKLNETEDTSLLLLKEKLLCGHPNPYTWSKSLAEQVVNEYSEYYPIVVMRPAVVCGSYREDPLVGWTDALNGFNALGLSTFLGVTQVLPFESEHVTDVIPVDHVTRALLIAAKKAAETKERIAVYNCGVSNTQPFSSKFLTDVIKEMEDKYPVKQKLWVTDAVHVTNGFLFSILFLLWQVLPFISLDIILKVTGNKPFFLNLAKKIANGYRMYFKFMSSSSKFPTDKYDTLEDCLVKTDKEEFTIDVSEIPLQKKEIIVNQILGILKYIFRSDLSQTALENNRKHLRRIKIAKLTLHCIQYLAVGWLLWYFIQRMI